MYVIAGVSGNTGSVTASTLLAQKQPVRVIVRDAAKGEPWKAKGAEVVVAAIEDQAALTKALAGATGAYLLLPPPAWGASGLAANRKLLSDSLLGAVRAAKPKHVVLLSSIGADLAEGTGPIKYLHVVEEGLKASGVPSTFLRAASFIENFGAQLKGAIDGGALYHGLKSDVALPHIATADIGKTAAKLLLEGPPSSGTRIVELGGPADVTLVDIAATIGKLAGKQVNAVTVPISAMEDSIAGMGASRELAGSFGEMTAAINDGRIRFHGKPVRGSIAIEQRLRELLG
jgi:uncharacterized protein YbjT (DUF2867 family)